MNQLETGEGHRQAESVIIGADLNGHVGMSGTDATSHGNRGVGERNDEGGRVVGSADTFELIIANTLLMKMERQLITFKSGSSAS